MKPTGSSDCKRGRAWLLRLVLAGLIVVSPLVDDGNRKTDSAYGLLGLSHLSLELPRHYRYNPHFGSRLRGRIAGRCNGNVKIHHENWIAVGADNSICLIDIGSCRGGNIGVFGVRGTSASRDLQKAISNKFFKTNEAL